VETTHDEQYQQFADKQPEATATAQLFEDWFDPIEAAVRAQVHEFIQGMIEAELDEALSRTRYVRRAKSSAASAMETAGGEDGSAKPRMNSCTRSRTADSMGSNQSSKSWAVAVASGCLPASWVILLVMRGLRRRFNAGITVG
jgi:hypothetical protein